ncbi:MAG: protein translocase subunit SecD [Erysipelotrichaceae bacterium]
MKKSRLYVFGGTVVALFIIISCFASDVANNMRLGLDLQGGFEIVYQIQPLKAGDAIPDMSAVAQSISKRIDILGVNEPDISAEGTDRVRVQLAGVKDITQARKIISSSANLTFRDVNDKLLMDATVLKKGGASLSFDNTGKPSVSLKIQDQARFYNITSEVSKAASGQNLMVTWLDFDPVSDSYLAETQKDHPKFVSSATVSQGINGDAVISGNFTKEEAKQMADLINSGSLPFKMNEMYSNAVTADYGANAFSSTIFAGAVGIALIMLFMILVYRLPGLISAISIAVYVFVVFLIYNTMGGVFTLSGIAALVLGVGMAVDSSIITFERIKDSMYAGRSVKSAFYEGNKKSLLTIFDSQLTTFISALILYIFGTGSVRGFATMLIVSVIATFLLIVFIVRFLLGLIIESGIVDQRRDLFAVKDSQVPDVSKGENQFYFGPFKAFDFVGKAKYFIMTSLVILVLALGSSLIQTASGNGPFNLGIDFTSGTKITVQSDTKINETKLRDIFIKNDLKPSAVKLSGDQSNIANITVKTAINEKDMAKLKKELKAVYKYDVNDNVVTPVIGRELIKNAVIISLLAWIGVLIYISLRFKWDYAISGIVALIHDVFIILAFCSIFRLEINTEIIAVMLAIIGYSINNSIVVFDRIRETLKRHTKYEMTPELYKSVVNDALQNTLIRSTLSSFTTILPVVCLLLLGSGAIFTFNLALIIGLVAGTGSSLFIASQLWLYIRIHHKGKPKKIKSYKKLDEVTEMIIPGVND